MADVRPFNGLRYNPQIVGPLSDVISPPFDIISSKLQHDLYDRSSHNVVRLEEGRNFLDDTSSDNRYTRAAATFAKWLKEGILQRENNPSFYLIRHTFNFDGKERVQLSLLSCVRLEEYERRVVLPHEFTQGKALDDRFSLMESCNANFSPVMSLYRDNDGVLRELFYKIISEQPLINLCTEDKHTFSLWKLDTPEQISVIQRGLHNKPLYIADGHHRYQTALRYRDYIRSKKTTDIAPNAAINFVLMGLIEMDDPGLFLLPYHRVIGNLDPGILSKIEENLKELFTFDPFPIDSSSGPAQLIKEVEGRNKVGEVLGLLGPTGTAAYILTLKQEVNLAKHGPISSFTGWVLEDFVFKPILGDSISEHLTWLHDAEAAAEMVNDGSQQMALFLKPLPLELFEATVSKGDRLPAKSTFFYPKLPTGLVLNQLDGTL